ncbi:MAG: Asp-tRNA(Asn)/Glu-tRNA(Gln) amidotransferase subunit GatB [bacterium]
MSYIPTIGLEIHAELKTNTKMFCGCKNGLGLENDPNVNVCPVCMGHPGTLPVANRQAIENIIKAGLALNCEIPKFAKFYRKNYFYPDLPKGYQITSQNSPFALGGFIEIGDKKIRIHHIHLEEDAGKLQHSGNSSLVDFNRAGVPLMELVSQPDIKSGEEARLFCQKLQLILRYLDVADADMERGQMRCEVNISVSKDDKFGTKVEIKNLNSFKTVEKAVNYEIKRQSEILDEGGKVIQETRGWNDFKSETFSQRIKEEAHDYRYFEDPDLPAIDIEKIDLERLKSEIVELPEQRRERYRKEYSLGEENISLLVFDKELGDYFEKVISELGGWAKSVGKELSEKAIKLAANYIVSELQKLLVAGGVKISDCKINSENFAELIKMIVNQEISSSAAQAILKEMFIAGGDPSQIVEERGLEQVSGAEEIETIVGEVIKNNPNSVEDYKAGKEKALQFLIGQVMKQSKGKANPEVAREVLVKKLK